MANLRREFQSVLNKKLDKPDVQPGLLGDGMGTVATGDPGKVYVRVNGQRAVAACQGVEYVNDLAVWVGRSVYNPTIYQVLEERVVGTSYASSGGIGQHRDTHLYGGTDTVWIDGRQWLPLRLYATGVVMEIGIIPWFVYIDGMPKLIGTDNLDGTYTPETVNLLDYMVTTDGNARFVLIIIDNTGVVVATAGTEVAIDEISVETDMPALPANWKYVLGAVRMFYGQYEVLEHRTNPDLVDLRFPMTHSHDGSELGLGIDNLTDVVITDPATGEVLKYNGTNWINNTLAEAGISAVGHDHDADYAPISDVQDLADHEADTDNPHQVTAGQLGTRWEVLTNGNPATPELMFDENGDVLYVEVS
jgi:hypothetical protein